MNARNIIKNTMTTCRGIMLDDRKNPATRSCAPPGAHLLTRVSTHELLRAGQLAPVRRELDQPPLF